jgi:hypothetical protein
MGSFRKLFNSPAVFSTLSEITLRRFRFSRLTCCEVITVVLDKAQMKTEHGVGD